MSALLVGTPKNRKHAYQRNLAGAAGVGRHRQRPLRSQGNLDDGRNGFEVAFGRWHGRWQATSPRRQLNTQQTLLS